MTVFLLGVHHEKQHNGIGSKKDIQFIQFIKNQSVKLNISLIAEEFNEEALEKTKATRSTSKKIAENLGINHLFCDPTTQEREKLGIPSYERIKKKKWKNSPKKNMKDLKRIEKEIKKEMGKEKYFKMREKFWLKQINTKIQLNILFICGTRHIKSFYKLLIKHNVKTKILNKTF